MQRPSLKLGKLFAAMQEKRTVEESVTVEMATKLVVELDGCTNAGVLRKILPRIQDLSMTAGVLQQSPSLADALEKAAKRCRKSKDESVVELLSAWRTMCQHKQEQDAQKAVRSGRHGASKLGTSAAKIIPEAPEDSQSEPLLPELEPPARKQRKLTAFFGDSAVATAGG
jgi:hypothetical protein